MTVRQHYQQGQHESNRRENALQMLRRPDDSDDHAVAEDQFNQVTGPAGIELDMKSSMAHRAKRALAVTSTA